MKDKKENVFAVVRDFVKKDPEALKTAKKVAFTHAAYFALVNCQFCRVLLSDSVEGNAKRNTLVLFVHALQQREAFRQLLPGVP